MFNIKYFLVLLVCLATTVINAQAAAGEFDLSFGNNGQVFGTIANTEAAQDVVLQTDGKILLASATIGADSSADFAVIRLNPNGTIDTSFGTNGKVAISFDIGASERASAIVVQPDGKILVTGNVEFGSPGYDFGVARLNSDGSVDTSFGNGGKVKIPVSNGPDYSSDMILQPDGKIVIVGSGYNQPNSDAVLVRLNSNGSLDTTFNGSGKIVTPIGTGAANDFLSAVALQPDGKIIAAGGNGDDFTVLRFNPNGSFDTTFDGDGKAITPIGTQRDEAFAIALQPDGKIIAAGSANSGSGNEAALVRYNANGSLDTTFDGDGKVTVIVRPIDSEVFKSVIIQSDGKIIAVGAGGDATFRGDFLLVRFNTNGSLDTSFGSGGKVIARIGNGDSAAYEAVLQLDGKIVVVGIGSNFGFAAARFLTAASSPRSVKFDFDGDRKSDISVFRPDTGAWYLLQSTAGFYGVQFGISTDKLVPADYDGDDKTDIAVYREGNWYLLRSTAGFAAVSFGVEEDIPQSADFDGDGKAEIAVYRPSSGSWYVLNLVNNQFGAVQFGASSDKPVIGDYDGDGRADFAVYRPENGAWYLLQSTAGFSGVQFGISTDKPIPSDYDGDGKTDIAVFREGNWYLLQSTKGFAGFQFGMGTDVPSPADYDGDGKADAAVFREGNWYLLQSTNGFGAIQFGHANDIPIPNVFTR